MTRDYVHRTRHFDKETDSGMSFFAIYVIVVFLIILGATLCCAVLSFF